MRFARLTVLALLVLALLAAPLVAEAQQPATMPRIAVVASIRPDTPTVLASWTPTLPIA